MKNGDPDSWMRKMNDLIESCQSQEMKRLEEIELMDNTHYLSLSVGLEKKGFRRNKVPISFSSPTVRPRPLPSIKTLGQYNKRRDAR